MGNNTPSVHESLRIKSETQARVIAQQQEGESKAATYNRVLIAGLDVLEAQQTSEEAQEASPSLENNQGEQLFNNEEKTLLNKLLEARESELSLLRDQLTTKDEELKEARALLASSINQNSELTAALKDAQATTKAAQVLHGKDIGIKPESEHKGEPIANLEAKTATTNEEKLFDKLKRFLTGR